MCISYPGETITTISKRDATSTDYSSIVVIFLCIQGLFYTGGEPLDHVFDRINFCGSQPAGYKLPAALFISQQTGYSFSISSYALGLLNHHPVNAILQVLNLRAMIRQCRCHQWHTQREC